MRISTPSVLRAIVAMLVIGGSFSFFAISAVRSEDEKSADAKPAAKSNPYLPRRGMSVEDLQAFLERNQEAPASIRNRPGFAEGMAVAADRMLQSNPTGSQRTFAVLALFDALHQWADLEENHEADVRLAELAEKYAADPDKKIAAAAKFFVLEQRVLKSDQLAAEKVPALLDDVKAALAGKDLDAKQVRIASATVHAVNRIDDKDDATAHLKDFGTLFAASKDSTLARYGNRLLQAAGVAEETTKWIGKPMELAGTTVDGAKFDITQFKDKIVLVDFWATWCPPCVAAIPELKELYEKYHRRGFEIVGVSLDGDLTALGDMIDKEGIPWTNLIGEGADGELKFPLAEKYQIRGVPTGFFVGKDGKIIANDLRGEELIKQVEKAFAAKSNPSEK